MEILQLAVPAVTALQEAYVRHVVDTVNDLDNVLYEISNEAADYSTAWQYHMIRLIHDYERAKPKQHPVGMTFQYAAKPIGAATPPSSPARRIGSRPTRRAGTGQPARGGRQQGDP